MRSSVARGRGSSSGASGRGAGRAGSSRDAPTLTRSGSRRVGGTAAAGRGNGSSPPKSPAAPSRQSVAAPSNPRSQGSAPDAEDATALRSGTPPARTDSAYTLASASGHRPAAARQVPPLRQLMEPRAEFPLDVEDRALLSAPATAPGHAESRSGSKPSVANSAAEGLYSSSCAESVSSVSVPITGVEAAVAEVAPQSQIMLEVEALPLSSLSTWSPIDADILTSGPSAQSRASPQQGVEFDYVSMESALNASTGACASWGEPISPQKEVPEIIASDHHPREMSLAFSNEAEESSLWRQRDAYTFGPDEAEALAARDLLSQEEAQTSSLDIKVQHRRAEGPAENEMEEERGASNGAATASVRSGGVGGNTSAFVEAEETPRSIVASTSAGEVGYLSALGASAALGAAPGKQPLASGRSNLADAEFKAAGQSARSNRMQAGGPAVSDWAIERSKQEKRLEAHLKQSAERFDRWRSVVDDSREVFRAAEGTRSALVAQQELSKCARLEQSYASECFRRDVADRRAQLGVLDSVAMEAGVGASRSAVLRQQQERMEEQLAALQKRQEAVGATRGQANHVEAGRPSNDSCRGSHIFALEAAEEAARRCWLATAARSIRTCHPFGPASSVAVPPV